MKLTERGVGEMIGRSRNPEPSYSEYDCYNCKDKNELKNGDTCQECCRHFFVADEDGMPKDEPCRRCEIDFNDLSHREQVRAYCDIASRAICAEEYRHGLRIGK